MSPRSPASHDSTWDRARGRPARCRDRVVEDPVGFVPLAGQEEGFRLVAEGEHQTRDGATASGKVSGRSGGAGGGERISRSEQFDHVEQGTGLSGAVPTPSASRVEYSRAATASAQRFAK